MTRVTVRTVKGFTFTKEGSNYRHENGIHYIAGESFPDSIVTSVEQE